MLSSLCNREQFSSPLFCISWNPSSACIAAIIFAAACKSYFSAWFSSWSILQRSWQSWKSCLAWDRSLLNSAISLLSFPLDKLRLARSLFKACNSLSNSSFSSCSFFIILFFISWLPLFQLSISVHLCWLLRISSWCLLLFSRASTTLSFSLVFCSVSSLIRISRLLIWKL